MASVADDLATRVVHSTDNSIYQRVPAAVATPRSGTEVAELLRSNHEAAAPLPIAARGGATATNGQGLTDGIVIDVKRHLRRVRSIDVDARLAVVEPGVVAARLDRELAPHGLRWAPHTSTINRATVGGMISTDAAGKGSLVHGRTHRHVAALDLCLADGTTVHLEPTPIDEARRLAGEAGMIGRLWSELLALPRLEPGSIGPALGRAWTGYGLDRLYRDDLVDPVQLVVGAEGSLGVITAAWLRLVPRPTSATMVVAVFDDFDTALEESLELAATRPTAIETFDETTLAAARSSRSWTALGAAVGDRPGAVLVLEYDAVDGEPPAPDELGRAVAASSRARTVEVIDDDARRRAVWTVRADAVGLLARQVVHGVGSSGAPTTARPVAMVEDCAVPVAALPRFIAEFRSLLDDAGLTYGMFGHADVGCVHVRPALDLTDPEHERLVGELTDRVVDLVDRHGGILWGEHGRGMRSAVVERVLDEPTTALMRRVKSAFDPDDRCNPGTLYRPIGVDAPIDGPLDAPLRGALDRRVPIEVRSAHASAFACNGNGLCHDVDAAAPMCPSYQVSGDPAWSPKGRADLLRTWLRWRYDTDGSGPPVGSDEFRSFEDALADNLDACLSCAACAGRCPVEVDVPELKSRFFEAYHADRRRPIADRVMSALERLAPSAAMLPGAARLVAGAGAGLVGLTDLPVPSRPARTGPAMRRFDPDAPPPTGDEHGVELVIVPDVFTSVIEPDTLRCAHDLLVATGGNVRVAPLLASGKYDQVIGRRAAFARAARRRHDLLRAIDRRGGRAVTIDPAVTLLYRHDDVSVDASFRNDRVESLADVLTTVVTRGGALPATDAPRHVTLLGHCTERALDPDELTRWSVLLTAAGHHVEVVEVGCCGMAGAFGHQRRHLATSRRLWSANWRPAVEAAPDAVAATGWSCRSQARRFADRAVIHPVELLTGRLG